MGYKDSDYTIMIAIMQWHKRIIVQKLILVVELRVLSPLFAIVRAHDPTVIGSVAHRKGPQFSSVWFGNPGMLHLQYIGFYAGPGPH